MTKCHFCNEEIGGEIHTLFHSGEQLQFCIHCDNEGNIATSWTGRRAPARVDSLVAAFDGTACGWHRGEREYLDSEVDGEVVWECRECGDLYYGEPRSVDSECNYCEYCCEANYYHYDGGWHFDECDDDVSPCLASESDTVSGYQKYAGDETERFLSDYYVGIEFEHAPVRTGTRFCDDSGALFCEINGGSSDVSGTFTEHYDGSIAKLSGYAAREIVSSPMSGHLIDSVINEFYRPFATGKFSPGPEHPTCGFHMHVGSNLINNIRQFGSDQVASAKRIAVKNALGDIARICSEFVSSARRKNMYCNGRVSVREKELNISGSGALRDMFGVDSYPSVAVRSIGTIEFRLWPSSNSIRYTKARAELSQKLIAYFDSCFVLTRDKLEINNGMADALGGIANLCAPVLRADVVAKLSALIGLSQRTTDDLQKMQAKFNPFTFKTTHFKLSDAQIMCLDDEPSEASAEYISPEPVNYAGDTLSAADLVDDDDGEGYSKKLYVSFKSGVRCYPATGEGEQLEAVTALAKGDI